MMFGSDWPLIRAEKWIEATKEAGFRDDVPLMIMKDKAVRVPGLE